MGGEKTEDDTEIGPPPSIEEFIISNYRVFTVIGVLGGLSVYLAQLSEELPFPRYGISGSLIIFLICASVALKNGMIAGIQARSLGGFKSHYLYMGYLGIVIGIISIMMTVVVILGTHFQSSAANLLVWIFMQILAIAYFGFIFKNKRIRYYNGRTFIGYGVRMSPYIAALLLVVFAISAIYADRNVDALSLLISDNPFEQMGAFFGAALVHLLYTIIIAVPAIILDKIITYMVKKFRIVKG